MIKLKLLIVCSAFLLLSSCQLTGRNKESVNIVAGSSKIMGKITIPDGQNKDSIWVTIQVQYPISGEQVKYEILADQSGKFSLDFDMETETSIVGIYTSVNPSKFLFVRTINNESTSIDISYDSGDNIKYIEITPAMNKYDIMQTSEILYKMNTYRSIDSNWEYPRLYDKSIDEVLDFAKKNVSKRMQLFVDHDNLLSQEVKDFIEKEYRLFTYAVNVFNYESAMMINYRNSTQDRTGKPEIKKIDRSYFRFLKDFNLNDPHYLKTFAFSEFQDSILQNETLGLPAIGERDITSWLTEVKSIIADVLGFKEGSYYDVLAANAYGLQMKEELKPLTDKQKLQITKYWGEGEIAKILFRKNNLVGKLANLKSPVVKNDLSLVADDKVMETILSTYKNKVVFIDLWATWCGPCLDAMKDFKSVKGNYKDNDVVFVYITNGSSPRKLWEEKINGIGGEHYYLKDEQWEYMMNYFGFEGIPSYLLFRKDGKLVQKFTGFPGNDKVSKMINTNILNLYR